MLVSSECVLRHARVNGDVGKCFVISYRVLYQFRRWGLHREGLEGSQELERLVAFVPRERRSGGMLCPSLAGPFVWASPGHLVDYSSGSEINYVRG